MKEYFANRRLSAAVLLLLCASAGCGTGEYEKRLNARVGQIGQESAFGQMHPPTQLSETPIKVRLPNSFGQPLGEGAGVDQRRVQPQVVNPVDVKYELKATYEGFVEDSEGGKTAYYCYLATLDTAEAKVKDPERALRRQLQETLGEGTGQWAPTQCETPTGRASQWQKITASGDQEFYYVDKDGQESFRKEPATVWFFSRREGEYWIAIGWRVPTRCEAEAGLGEWAPRVAGSVSTE
jgi:hypothetical protein